MFNGLWKQIGKYNLVWKVEIAILEKDIVIQH